MRCCMLGLGGWEGKGGLNEVVGGWVGGKMGGWVGEGGRTQVIERGEGDAGANEEVGLTRLGEVEGLLELQRGLGVDLLGGWVGGWVGWEEEIEVV